MKKYLLSLIVPAALATAGCADKEPGADNAGTGTGRIVLAATADATIHTRAAEGPAAEDFSFSLTADGYEGRWQSVADFAQCDTLFREGRYTARIAWGDPEAEGAGMPCYEGVTEFDLLDHRTNTVRIVARIANSQTVVRATEQFLRYFSDARFSVETTAGNRFAFTPGAGAADEPVFVQAGTTLTVTGTARRQSQTGTDEGPLAEFTLQPLAGAKPRTCHIFTFDAADAGSATVNIQLDEGETVTEPVAVELNDAAIPEK